MVRLRPIRKLLLKPWGRAIFGRRISASLPYVLTAGFGSFAGRLKLEVWRKEQGGGFNRRLNYQPLGIA
jgi:hypothetical protein